MSSIAYDGRGLVIGGQHKVIISGEFHYFRTPSSLWEDRIRKMAQGGCNAVATYIPWNWHEEHEGVLKWDGEQDVDRFLKLCKKYGLYVIVKPGPYICAEWDFGGYPHWLYAKDIPLRVGHKKYLALVKKWFDEVAEVIRPHLITRGGNIIMIQVENEYDHLIKLMPEVFGNKDDAKAYILKLLEFVRKAGIDVPAFSNDGACIFGTEIINTNTYYPNIPGLVLWVFDFFDQQLDETREEQPGKPLMVMEAQGGWFSQHGMDFYDLPLSAFEAVTKSITAYGASLINFYMYTGGTNFPYWGSMGLGMGLTTSYDFRGAPVSEWGAIQDRHRFTRLWAQFLQCFPDLVNQGATAPGTARIISGNEKMTSLHPDGARTHADFTDTYTELRVLPRKSPDRGALLLRNLEDEDFKVQIAMDSATTGGELVFPAGRKLTLPAKQAMFLPTDFAISDSIRIVYATSEICLKKDIADTTYVFLRGNRKVHGEMLIQAPTVPEPVEGDLKVRASKHGHLLRYSHADRTVFRIEDHLFICLEETESLKVWMQDRFLLQTDIYHLDDVRARGRTVKMNLLVKPEGRQRNLLWMNPPPKKIALDGKKVAFKKDRATGAAAFDIRLDEIEGNHAEFVGKWKYAADSEETREDYDDASWATIPADKPLEKAGHYEHGYFWYRANFEVPAGAKDVRIDFKTNDTDRYLLFVNGQFIGVQRKNYWHSIDHVARPGVNTMAVLYANEFHTKAHPNEGPIEKLSGLYNPVTVLGWCGGREFAYRFPEYRVRYGLGGVLRGFGAADLDDSDWMKAPLSEKYIVSQDTGIIAWFRRNFRYEKRKDCEAPLRLTFRDLKERCFVYVNGVAVAQHEHMGPQFDYYIPENLLKKNNQLTLLIEGPGYHYRRTMGYRPAFFSDPELGFFHEAKRMTLTVE